MINDDKPSATATFGLARAFSGAFVRRTAVAAGGIALIAVGLASWLDHQATAAGPALASARSTPDIAARLAALPKPDDSAQRQQTARTWFWRADTTPTASIRSKPQFKNFVTDPSVGMPQ